MVLAARATAAGCVARIAGFLQHLGGLDSDGERVAKVKW